MGLECTLIGNVKKAQMSWCDLVCCLDADPRVCVVAIDSFAVCEPCELPDVLVSGWV